MCLYAQLVQTKNKQCKKVQLLSSADPQFGFCFRPRPIHLIVSHTIYPGATKIYLVFLNMSVVSADITISGKLFHIFTILGAKEFFSDHSNIY